MKTYQKIAIYFLYIIITIVSNFLLWGEVALRMSEGLFDRIFFILLIIIITTNLSQGIGLAQGLIVNENSR